MKVKKSTSLAAGKPWVESLPRCLLLVSGGLLAFFLLKDMRSGLRLDEIGFYFTDYAIAVTFAVIGVLLSIGLRIQKLWDGNWPPELNKTSFSRRETLRTIIAMIWAFSIVLAPWLALFLNIFDLTPSNWRVLFGIRATLLVVIPVLGVLPLLHFVRGRAAPLVLAFLALGTAFPALTGLQSAIDVLRGPEWQIVSVTTFGADELDLVKLSDGRMLRYPERLDSALQSGSTHRVLVLRASRYILDVH
jgi:hypothetical protein